MILFNELRITHDGRYLIMDVEIQDLSYYLNIGLFRILLNAYKSSEEYPTKGYNLYLWKINDALGDEGYGQVSIEEEPESPIKRVRKIIDIDSILDNLFFISVIADGELAADTPCGAKDNTLLGIVYNKGLLYSNGINVIKTINNCTPSKEAIDFILRLKLFTTSIEVGDYKSAIDYWNNTFKKPVITTKSNCGCNGY